MKNLSETKKTSRGLFTVIKDFLGIRKLTTRELTSMGMLLAIAVLMSMFFTFRIGNAIKIPTKFLPIAIASMLFGPLCGGLIGILADILAYMFNPVAGFMPQITFIEFLYGFTYGLFLSNVRKSPQGFLKAISCVLFQIIFLHIFLTSYILIPVMGVNYTAVLLHRLPAAAVNTVLQTAGICFIVIYSDMFRKLSGGIKQ